MNINLCFVICVTLFGLIHTSVVHAQEPPSNSILHDLSDNDRFVEAYVGQDTFHCGQAKVDIPTLFPTFSKNIKVEAYLVAFKKNCSLDDYKIDLTSTQRCSGQHDCVIASFTSFKVPSQNIYEILSKLMDVKAKRILLDKGRDGYVIPSQCFAYCNQSQLIWSDRKMVNVLGIMSNDSESAINEMRDSANSLINKE